MHILARSIAESTYGRAKMCKNCPKDAAKLYERNPKFRLIKKEKEEFAKLLNQKVSPQFDNIWAKISDKIFQKWQKGTYNFFPLNRTQRLLICKEALIPKNDELSEQMAKERALFRDQLIRRLLQERIKGGTPSKRAQTAGSIVGLIFKGVWELIQPKVEEKLITKWAKAVVDKSSETSSLLTDDERDALISSLGEILPHFSFTLKD